MRSSPDNSRRLARSRTRNGTANELLVQADLLRRGWDVYVPLDTLCGCDLLADDGDRILRIEVKTAYARTSGELGCFIPYNQRGRYDVLAMIGPDGGIVYVPPICNEKGDQRQETPATSIQTL